MSAVDLLASVISVGAKVSFASLRRPEYARALVEIGLLRECGVVGAVVCTDCEEPHAAEVIFDAGKFGYFCPALGFNHLARTDITAVEVNLPLLIESLADVFACTRRKTTPVHGNTWRIGAIKTDHGDVMLYFHPGLKDENDALALADGLSREMGSQWRLVGTAEGRLTIGGVKTTTLGEIVTFSDEGEGFVPMVDPREIVCVPASPKTGAPNRFGEKITALIRSRIVTGTALPGRNEEAKAVLALLKQDFGPDVPTLPTVKSYVTKVRSG